MKPTTANTLENTLKPPPPLPPSPTTITHTRTHHHESLFKNHRAKCSISVCVSYCQASFIRTNQLSCSLSQQREREWDEAKLCRASLIWYLHKWVLFHFQAHNTHAHGHTHSQMYCVDIGIGLMDLLWEFNTHFDKRLNKIASASE